MLPLLLALVLAAPLAGCGLFGSEPRPEDALRTFLDGLGAGDTAGAAQVTDNPQAAQSTLDAMRRSLKPEALRSEIKQVRAASGAATAEATVGLAWELGRERRWSYDTTVELRRSADRWTVHWSPKVLHPRLSAQQTMVVREQQPEPAPLLDREGVPLLTPQQVISVLLDRGKAGDVATVAAALAGALNQFDGSITATSILEGANRTPEGQAYVVAVLRESDYQRVKPQIYDLPGVRFTTQTRLLAVDRGLGAQVLPALRQALEDRLAGSAGWRVVAVDAAGGETQTLHEVPAQPAPAVNAALSRQVQAVAEDAVEPVSQQAVLVAIQPSTGDILAVAQNGPADAAGPISLIGRYPPGSTFKIVTAAAALQEDLVSVDTPVGCPGTWIIQGRLIPNDNRFDLGTVPLSTAFARSCNTTFAELATRLPANSLTETARQLGLGVDFVVPGVTTVTGSVPPAEDVVERAEDGFGQGKVLASPFGMALVAATVARGEMPTPVLVRGERTQVDAVPRPLPASVLDGVRTMMREVVTAGTATRLAELGEVYGKTGTAQFGDGSRSHGWFVGYRGDLAFAVLVVDAGTSAPAVEVAARFLAAVG